MSAPESIKQLVEKFKGNREAYRSGKYNEAQLRQQFISQEQERDDVRSRFHRSQN